MDRQVSSTGTISLASRALCIGAHLAGRRVIVRLDGITARVMDEQRLLLRAVPCPLPLAECLALRDARPAGPPPTCHITVHDNGEPIRVVPRTRAHG
ncbi:hypothetical protein ACWENQ_08145 [Nonomuraea sp. NPDC004354]